jgi:hypothetical protein
MRILCAIHQPSLKLRPASNITCSIGKQYGGIRQLTIPAFGHKRSPVIFLFPFYYFSPKVILSAIFEAVQFYLK